MMRRRWLLLGRRSVIGGCGWREVEAATPAHAHLDPHTPQQSGAELENPTTDHLTTNIRSRWAWRPGVGNVLYTIRPDLIYARPWERAQYTLHLRGEQ